MLRDGVPVLACGSPGGDQQDQWQSLFLLRHVVGGMGLQEAIDAPMFHTTSFPGSFHPREMEPGVLVVEDRIPTDVLDGPAPTRARGGAAGAVVAGPDVCGQPRPRDRPAAGGRQPARDAGVRRRALAVAR